MTDGFRAKCFRRLKHFGDVLDAAVFQRKMRSCLQLLGGFPVPSGRAILSMCYPVLSRLAGTVDICLSVLIFLSFYPASLVPSVCTFLALSPSLYLYCFSVYPSINLFAKSLNPF